MQWCKQKCNSACVAAITVPIVVGITLIGTGIWCCHRRCQRRRLQGQMGMFVPTAGVVVNGVMVQPMPAVYMQPTVGYPAQPAQQPQWNYAGPGAGPQGFAGPQYAQGQPEPLYVPPGQQKVEQQYALR